jgi:hypothetical protein
MKANTTTKNGECRSESRTAVSRAIDWLQSYIDEDLTRTPQKKRGALSTGWKPYVSIQLSTNCSRLLRKSRKPIGVAGNKQGNNPNEPN